MVDADVSEYLLYCCTHQAVDHAQASFAQVLGHLEDVHQFLRVCAVQKLPQGAEDSGARGAVTGTGDNHVQCVKYLRLYMLYSNS